MDPEKQKALDAVKDKENPGYDVNGVRCHTATEVHAAWKDGIDVPDPVPPADETKPKKHPPAK